MRNIEKEIAQLSGWELDGKFIIRKITFDSFQDALQMMRTIGQVCDELNHHPDWTNVYNRLTIKLTTHDADCVTEKDIELAKRINQLIG
jgi:4a-hydroxytetrahydrobiopterin dehydratase